MIEFDDLNINQCIELGVHEIPEEEIVRFAAAWDPQGFHLHQEDGKASLFGSLCASGWHTAVILHRLTVDRFLSRVKALGSAGLDGLKWPKPVFPGDTLKAELVITGKRISKSRPNVGILTTESLVHNQNNDCVLVQNAVLMIDRGQGTP